MTIPSVLTWDDGEIELPYRPWLDSPLKNFMVTKCCIWVHLTDGFSLRYQKDSSRLRIYHAKWDLSNGPIIDVQGSLKAPASQEEFDKLLVEAAQTIRELSQ